MCRAPVFQGRSAGRTESPADNQRGDRTPRSSGQLEDLMMSVRPLGPPAPLSLWQLLSSSSSLQFASWVDAVILVFSLENEASFQEVYKIYHQLAAHRPISEIPFVVVGTQGQTRMRLGLLNVQKCTALLNLIVFLDKISSTNPRVIDDARARQLCSDVRRCTYYETCATYGLNVNRVFNDGMSHHGNDSPVEDAANAWGMLTVLYLLYSTAAQKIIMAKKQAALLASCKSLPNSPTHSGGSTPVSGVFPGQVGPLWAIFLIMFLFFFLNELFFSSSVGQQRWSEQWLLFLASLHTRNQP